MLRSCPSINLVADCGAIPESLSTMTLTRSVALKTPQKRKQEGEKREDREKALVGEVASKCHDLVFVHLLVSQLGEVDETQVLRDGDLDLVTFSLGLLISRIPGIFMRRSSHRRKPQIASSPS